ncbi:MAG: cytochrome c maturation protein CcmE [Pseudomonadota bacterium]
MKPLQRNRRLGLIAAGGTALAGAAFLVFSALENSVSYFYTPSEIDAATLAEKARIRLGGLVEAGSLVNADDATVLFKVTDGERSIDVAYRGILPDLFREGQGVIAQGRFGEDGQFVADTILAKHDENYVPKELAETIENAGHPVSN